MTSFECWNDKRSNGSARAFIGERKGSKALDEVLMGFHGLGTIVVGLRGERVGRKRTRRRSRDTRFGGDRGGLDAFRGRYATGGGGISVVCDGIGRWKGLLELEDAVLVVSMVVILVVMMKWNAWR